MSLGHYLQAIETHRVGPVLVKLYPDDSSDHDCPMGEAYGDKGQGLESEGVIFACFERRSTLSDYHRFDSPDAVLPWARANGWQAFPLIKYEHGASAYSISRAYPFNCPWDSGQVGFILVKRSAYRGEAKRRAIADSWCKAVTTWVNGYYYGFAVESETGETLDSCWGFDCLDYCREEAMAMAKHHAEITDTESARDQEEARPDLYNG